MENLSWENQELLISWTVHSPIVLKHNILVFYQINFLRFIIDWLENNNMEVHDQFYELYVELLEITNKTTDYSYRHFKLPQFNNIVVTVKESKNMISDGTTGLRSWQASGALAEWAIHNRKMLHGKQILELGSGTGLTGCIIAKVCEPRKIVLSDGNDMVIRLLRENCDNNFNMSENDLIYVDILEWDNYKESRVFDNIQPDIVMAADVVYDNTLFQPLCSTVDYIFKQKNDECIFILACTMRNEETFNEFTQILGTIFMFLGIKLKLIIIFNFRLL